ncbi:MAG: NAD(P)H-hydrate dehydratase [Pseudomonadota bacterium]|nr:NAD(P)H-hydrate dehydratase [Pseudomonadota bacterium]
MTAAYSVKQIREFEKSLIEDESFGINGLLESASKAIFKVCIQRIKKNQKVLVVCGKGYNGVDAIKCGTLLKKAGYRVYYMMCYRMVDCNIEFQQAHSEAVRVGVIEEKGEDLTDYDVLIDGIYGIGYREAKQDHNAVTIQKMNRSGAKIISIDVPSGVNADTGVAAKDAIRATTTLSLLIRKRGLYTKDAFDHVGELLFDDLGHQYQNQQEQYEIIEIKDRRHDLIREVKNTHKYSFGRALVIGGNYGMLGASVLTAKACAKMGCGYVMMATRDNPALAIENPDFVTVSIDEIDGIIQAGKVTVIIIGPGLGRDDWALACMEKALKYKGSMVMDADALQMMVQKDLDIGQKVVMTPHEGEAGVLLGVGSADVRKNRFEAIDKLYQKFEAKMLLKGAGTLIKVDENVVKVINHACPGMSVAGSGDVLAGMIGGYIAQGVDNGTALLEAALIHVEIGMYYQEINQGRGMMASEMIEMIPMMKNKKEG